MGHLCGLCILRKTSNSVCLSCWIQMLPVWDTTIQHVWFQMLILAISSTLIRLLPSSTHQSRNKFTLQRNCQNNLLRNTRSSITTKSNWRSRKKTMKAKCVTNKSSRKKNSDSDKLQKQCCKYLSQNIRLTQT